MDSSERGINPVAMTIIKPRKEYWLSRGSNQRPPVLKSTLLLAEPRGLAISFQGLMIDVVIAIGFIQCWLCEKWKSIIL